MQDAEELAIQGSTYLWTPQPARIVGDINIWAGARRQGTTSGPVHTFGRAVQFQPDDG